MWTSMVDLDPRRALLTRILGSVWRGAYFASFAPLSVQNVPRQALPAANWVRVRNRLGGICGSDLHLIYVNGDVRVAPAALPGHSHAYLGHEVVGEVIEVGEGVGQLRVGDRVALQSGANCVSADMQPRCHACAAGNYNLCEYSRLPGPWQIGGGWSEEMLLHESQLFRVGEEISDEQAVMLEPTAVALHAVLRCVPKAGERVLIVGAGTIGLLTLQVVKALAPGVEISVLARHPFQMEQAMRMGAAHIIYPQNSYADVQRVTNARLYRGVLGNKMLLGGYDVIYDTVGSSKTVHDALRWVRAQATVVLVGVSLHLMHIDLTPIWSQEIKLVGSLGHGMECWPGQEGPRSTFSIAEEMIKEGLLHPEQLITDRFALNKYREALEKAADKGESRAIKVLFDYALLPASVVPNVRASARIPRPAALPVNVPPTPVIPPTPAIPDSVPRVEPVVAGQEIAQEDELLIDPEPTVKMVAQRVPVVNLETEKKVVSAEPVNEAVTEPAVVEPAIPEVPVSLIEEPVVEETEPAIEAVEAVEERAEVKVEEVEVDEPVSEVEPSSEVVEESTVEEIEPVEAVEEPGVEVDESVSEAEHVNNAESVAVGEAGGGEKPATETTEIMDEYPEVEEPGSEDAAEPVEVIKANSEAEIEEPGSEVVEAVEEPDVEAVEGEPDVAAGVEQDADVVMLEAESFVPEEREASANVVEAMPEALEVVEPVAEPGEENGATKEVSEASLQVEEPATIKRPTTRPRRKRKH